TAAQRSGILKAHRSPFVVYRVVLSEPLRILVRDVLRVQLGDRLRDEALRDQKLIEVVGRASLEAEARERFLAALCVKRRRAANTIERRAEANNVTIDAL